MAIQRLDDVQASDRMGLAVLKCVVNKQPTMRHELKTWPAFFADLKAGRKTFELRKNDRNFEIGDRLILREYDPERREYTGRKCFRTVTHVLRYAPSFGLEVGYAILSI